MKRNGQLEFDWTWAERKQCIDDAQLVSGRAKDVVREDGSVKPGSRVAASTMCSLLRAINDCLGKNCEAWPSQKRLAQVMKVSTKTVQRAAQALERMNLLIIEDRPCPSGTQNYYRIVWNDLRLLTCQQAVASSQPSDTVSGPSDILTEASDIVSGPSDTMSTELKETIKNEKQLLVATAPGAMATASPVVVSSFEIVLKEIGVFNPKTSLRQAREVLKLSNSEIEERINAWQARYGSLPREEAREFAGILNNWLTRPRSYAPKVEPPKLRFKSLSPAHERHRAELIRYGRAKSWSHAQMQAAIDKYDADPWLPGEKVKPVS